MCFKYDININILSNSSEFICLKPSLNVQWPRKRERIMTKNTFEIDSLTTTVTTVLQAVIDAGVRDFCICPGGRNAPFISHLKLEPELHQYFFYDERSAAFFALGLSRSTERPVAVITTSGTAIAHLLPAAMEAYYTGIPLVLMTADRPRRFRGSNAPQSAEQVNIFGQYSGPTIDVAEDEPCDLRNWNRASPLHINICLEEPNSLPLPSESGLTLRETKIKRNTSQIDTALENLDRFLKNNEHPFVVVGQLPRSAREGVVHFLNQLKAPVYLEAISGLREDPRLDHLAIRRTDGLWKAAEKGGYPIKSIIRIGGVPTFRLWRDIEERQGEIAVFSINDVPFSGLSWGEIIPVPLDLFFEKIQLKTTLENQADQWLSEDRQYQQKLLQLMANEPTAETSLIHALSKIIPKQARIFLGNSLPIREWNLAATLDERHYDLYASRGLNGIDGQTSTFYGLCTKEQSNWGLLGDLTALHDMSAPWILRNRHDCSANLVIMNNGGGKIFDRIFKEKAIQNNHHTGFNALAALWELDYEQWTHVPKIPPADSQRIIEIIPDEEASQRFWKGVMEL